MQQYQTVCKSTSTVENFLKQKESRERYIFLPMKTDKRGPERMIAAYYPVNLIIWNLLSADECEIFLNVYLAGSVYIKAEDEMHIF